MFTVILYTLSLAILLTINAFNKRKIKKIHADIGSEQSITLNDGDLIPILRHDDESEYIITKQKLKFIALQKKLILSSMLAGVHTLLVVFLSMFIMLNLRAELTPLDWSLVDWLLFATFIFAANLFSKLIFLYDLTKIGKSIYLDPGHSTKGKSFFYFNPMFGYKYFAYNEQLDNLFGLSNNKDKA